MRPRRIEASPKDTNLNRIVSISVTLDGMPELGARFGIPLDALKLPAEEIDPIYGKVWPRFLALFARLDLSATFFPLGAYLSGAIQTALAREALASGHELGNYTYSGMTQFGALPEAEVAAEIQRGEEAIYEATSQKPRGFCAPAHQGGAAARAALQERGYLYEASSMALPALAAVGLGAANLLRRVGVQVPALFNEPASLWASSRPRPINPNQPLWSLPVSAVPLLRLPLCGAVVGALGAAQTKVFARLFQREKFVHFSFSGADLLADEEISDAVRARRPDLRVSLEERERAFEEALQALTEGAKVLPLQDAYSELRNT